MTKVRSIRKRVKREPSPPPKIPIPLPLQSMMIYVSVGSVAMHTHGQIVIQC